VGPSGEDTDYKEDRLTEMKKKNGCEDLGREILLRRSCLEWAQVYFEREEVVTSKKWPREKGPLNEIAVRP